jgi:hypothetical protein
VASESKGAEKADLGAAADDVGGNGVGDEKHANDKGDEGKGGEVELKGAEHFLNLLAASLGGAGASVGWKLWGDAFDEGGAGCVDGA